MINRIKKYLNRKRVLGSIKRFCKCNSDEIGTKEILEYLEKYEPTYFNYYWFRNYNLLENYDIQKDDGRYYINYCGHRMYFKKQWDFDQVIRYLKNLLPEQDKRSPHLYFAEGEKKAHYGCVIDAGGAEGMFALSILDIADKIYIIEYDSDWVEALEKTFEDYRDRVYIVRKMLSNIDNESECSLASFVKDNEKIDLVKLDIEGYEKIALSTVDELLIKHFDEFLVCVYHYQDEEKEIKDYFGEFKNTEIKTRSGFIYFLHDEKQKWPYLRRGVIRVKIN